MASQQLDLEIKQGKTFVLTLQWGTTPILFVPITNVTKAAPPVVSATGHGLPAGWQVAVVSVQGMDDLNAKNDPPLASEYMSITIVDVNSVKLDGKNTSAYGTYKSGGYLRTYTPVDMASYTARMTIKDKIGGTILAALLSPTDIVIDNTGKTITVTIAATVTAAMTKGGVYDIEMVNGLIVKELASGKVSFIKEVTT